MFYTLFVATNKKTPGIFQTRFIIRDTCVVDVIRLPTNLLELWATIVNDFFSAFGTNDH